LPIRIATSTITAPASIRPKQTHAILTEKSRVLSSVVPTKYRMAISKLRIQKISMLRPCSVSTR
jgi:hypothetical protein